MSDTAAAGRAIAAPAGAAAPAAEAAGGWGMLPGLSLAGSAGLLALALANSAAPAGAWWAELAFWAGLLALFLPAAVRLAGAGAPRRERLGLLALLGLGLYMVKLMHSPLGFTFSDELQHWRTAHDIAQTGALFQDNPLLPVSPLFPGLESATSALAELGGLSIFTAGLIVVGAARLLGTLALFLLYERASGSARAAGLAALLYMANPSYLFFSAQYAYESLAVPLAALALWALARRAEGEPGTRVGLTLAAVLALAAVVVTHHLTSYALAAFLLLWRAVALRTGVGRWALGVRGGDPAPGTQHQAPGASAGPALMAVVASAAWLAYVAALALTYLAGPVSGALMGTLQLVAGEESVRELFRSSAGQVAPLWERAAGYASVGLMLAGLALGLRRAWGGQRAGGLGAALAVASLAYPASLTLRLTERGAEISNRASAFVFVALAFVVGYWLAARPAGGPRARLWPAAAGALATAAFVGGVVVGWPGWARLPGPYLAAADTRSVERQSLAAAGWARDTLGPGNRVIADRTNRLLMGAFGEQRPVTNYRDKVRVANIFFASEVGPAELALLRRGDVRYVVVDRRIGGVMPHAQVYVERGEPGAQRREAPLDPGALAKFDRLPGARRVFDSGDIVIYDVGALSHEP